MPPAAPATPPPAEPVVTAESPPVRVGLVGAGPWAHLVGAPMLAAGPHTSLSGVWARRPEAAAELAGRHGAPAADTLSALCDRSDVVAFAVPPGVQAELALTAVGAGKAVLLDKPIAADLDGAERLAQAIEDAGVASGVLLTWRYTDAVRRFLADGAGTSARSGIGRFTSGALLGGPFATPWRLERGPLLDLGPHVIDLLDAALGTVVDLDAGSDRHGTVELTLHHEGGAWSTATLCGTEADPGAHRAEVAVEGDDGRRAVDCAAAVGPATFVTVARELAARVRGQPAPQAPDVRRGLHLQRLLQRAEARLR